MRCLMNNHKYDTEYDTLVGKWSNGLYNEGYPMIAGSYYEEDLYVNGSGTYYLHILAGKDANVISYGSSTDFTGGGHGPDGQIKPITKEEAEAWKAAHIK